MLVSMRDSSAPLPLPGTSTTLVVHGLQVDERGELALSHLNSVQGIVLAAEYDPDQMTLRLGESTYGIDDLENEVATIGADMLIADATTLSFAELFVISHAARKAGIDRIVFQYVEPREYVAPSRSADLHPRDFALSERLIGFKAIPGRARLLDHGRNQRVMFLVGFEGDRLDRAFEGLNLNPRRTGVVLGLPAYFAGWEMNTFENVAPVLDSKNVGGGVYFCGADNPLAVYDLLEQQYTQRVPGTDFFVSPIGTKPHGIGALLFVLEHDDVGLLYDHPQLKHGRTSQAVKWHVFEARW